MAKGIIVVGFCALTAATLAGCSAGDVAPSERERGVGRSSQALLPGSCRPFSCGTFSLDGCWCDAVCVDFGDCCADKIAACDVPERSLPDYPPPTVNFWAQESQGVSHDATSWFLSQNGPPPRISKVPLSYDLVGTFGTVPPPEAVVATIPTALQPINETALQSALRLALCQVRGQTCLSGIQVRVPGYDHVGDPDVYGSYVFVPLSGVAAPAYGIPDPPTPLVAVYRTSDMSFVRTSTVCGLIGANGGVGWVATDPNRKLLYTSNSYVQDGKPIQVCNIIDANIGLQGAGGADNPFLTFNSQIPLVDQNGALLELPNMQGGDVSDDGTHLFLSNGCCNNHIGNDYGLRAFDLSLHPGKLIVTAAKSGLRKWVFPFCLDPGDCFDEPEGVDFGSVTGAPNISSSAMLHVVLLKNGVLDAEDFKHWAF
ncbi:MAG: hypothetical protein QM756_09590 [Polyangiaceae bacterium]